MVMVQLSAAKYIGAMLRRVLDGLSSQLPSQCQICQAWPSAVFCSACVRLFAPAQARCPGCALPLAGPGPRCATCCARHDPLDQAFAALPYVYPWITLIQQYKFQEYTGWARSFAALMQQNPHIALCMKAADQVIPMPLSSQRLRTRGFNQAVLLARALCPSKVCTTTLARTNDTPAQSTLTRRQRWRNVRNAYQVQPGNHVAHTPRIVLVDDVMTTGASLSAAARALRQAGARHISAVVLARAE